MKFMCFFLLHCAVTLHKVQILKEGYKDLKKMSQLIRRKLSRRQRNWKILPKKWLLRKPELYYIQKCIVMQDEAYTSIVCCITPPTHNVVLCTRTYYNTVLLLLSTEIPLSSLCSRVLRVVHHKSHFLHSKNKDSKRRGFF